MKDPIGILIYGYNKEDVLKIKTAFDQAVADSIFVISASGKETWLVADILDKGPEEIYEDKEFKIIMFLAFTKEQVDASLKDFPSPEVTRPIFCGLTIRNVQWVLKHLIEHLQEEHRQFTNQATQPAGKA